MVCALAIYFQSYAILIGAMISGLIFSLAVYAKSLVVRICLGSLAASITAFAIGFGLAANHLNPSGIREYFGALHLVTIETKWNGNLVVKLIRSGDRGVLFFNTSTKEVTLLRWNEIKRISTVAVP